MPNLTTLTYGSYDFSPVPFFTLVQDEIQNKDGRVGTKYTLTLEGTLSTSPDLSGGIENVISLQESLRAAFVEDGLKLELKCGETSLLVCYPKLSGPIQFPPSNNNWVFTCPYTIELEFEDFREDIGDNPFDQFVEQASETWNVEFIDDSPKYNINLSSVSSQTTGYYYSGDNNYLMLRVSHNLNAIGQRHYIDMSGTGVDESGDPSGIGVTGYIVKEAWEYARDWCIPRLGLDSGVLQDSGVLNLRITGAGGIASYYPYNHIRATSRSETQGSYSVDESWLIALSGSGESYSGALRATEDFTVEVVQQAQDDLTQVNIQGSIQGWENRDYGDNPNDFVITETKMQAAEQYWTTIQNRLLPRAQYYSEAVASRSLNITPLTKTKAYTPSKGTISYSYSYDDRPMVRISGALVESINIDWDHPTDVYASLPILGRSAGAIIQSMNTYTNPTLNLSIECTMPRPTGTGYAGLLGGRPTTQVNALLCDFQTNLTGEYASVHVVNNKEGWNPIDGKYLRQMSWLLGICSGSIYSGVCD